MASSSWKKIIVSGSSAELNSLNTTNNIFVGGELKVTQVSLNNLGNSVVTYDESTGKFHRTGSYGGTGISLPIDATSLDDFNTIALEGTSSFAVSASFVNGDNLAVSFSNASVNAESAVSASNFNGVGFTAESSSHADTAFLAVSGGVDGNQFHIVGNAFVEGDLYASGAIGAANGITIADTVIDNNPSNVTIGGILSLGTSSLSTITHQITGNLHLSSSVGIMASMSANTVGFHGTSSFAVSASNFNGVGFTAESASNFSGTASFAISASNALFASESISGSHAQSASNAIFASQSISASHAELASNAISAISASNFNGNNFTASHAIQANNAFTASFAGSDMNSTFNVGGNIQIKNLPVATSGQFREVVTYDVSTGRLYYTGSYGGGGGADEDWHETGSDNIGNYLTSSVKVGVKRIPTTYDFEVQGTMAATTDVIAFMSSDKRLKDNIKPIEDPIGKIKQIGGYSFDWNDKQNIYQGNDFGVIAQEIEKVLPSLVKDREDGYKGVKYDKIVSLLIEAIKDQQTQIDDLKNQIKECR